MPFSGSTYAFNEASIATVYEVGAVYGLFKPSAIQGWFDCLYVGRTENLRKCLSEHLKDPPVAGATHFFAEVHSSKKQRSDREAALIAEFRQWDNKTARQ
jgi:hypothetical protein